MVSQLFLIVDVIELFTMFYNLQKLAELSNKIQRIEIMMSILEAKVNIYSKCLPFLSFDVINLSCLLISCVYFAT